MKRLLIVSPHFPPVNAPDMQRVRLALPYLRENGWEPVVLALDPAAIEGAVVEPLLESTYPADIGIVRTRGLSPRATRWAGVGNLWLRTGRAFTAAGDRLLTAHRFDLVFISTTQFTAFKLGPRWQRRFGVPFVLDYQDPWINPYYDRTHAAPPGGRLKFALSQWIARRLEPAALRQAAGIVAVSEAYARELAANYPWFDAARVQLLPFGAAPQDFAMAANHRPAAPLIDFDDGCTHLVYAGRCGPDMRIAMTVLFRAFKLHRARQPREAERMRFHFIGTDYAPPPLGRDWATPIARSEGVADYVSEHRYRVPYFDTIHYLRRADAIVGVGSNDPTYAASKIFPYILSRRPLLLIYHRNSLVLKFARELRVGARYSFAGDADIDALAVRIQTEWLAQPENRTAGTFDEQAFGPYTARALTRQLAAVFDRATGSSDPS